MTNKSYTNDLKKEAIKLSLGLSSTTVAAQQATHVLARAIIIHKDHILLCKTVDLDPNIYFTPGGHIEPTETAKQALYRELLEEIGFDFIIKRFLGCIEYSFESNEITQMHCHTREYNFFFEATAKEIELQLPIPK